MTQVANSAATTNYTAYDPLGRVTGSNEQTAGQTYNFSYLYNRAGALTGETYPSGRVVATGYDGANRVNAVTGTLAGQNTSYVSNLAYTPHGAPYSYMYGIDQRPNGKNLWPGSTYNSRLQPTQIYGWFNDDGDQFVYYFWYSWGSTNNNGNVQYLDEKAGNGVPWGSMTDFGQSFTYDSVNRLSSVSDSGGYSRSFGYDQYGNSWVSALSGIGYGPATPAWNIYSATTNQIPSSPYDAAGNMLALPPSYTFTYDAENRQTSEVNSGTPNATYSYDGNGARVQRAVTGSANASYVYDAFGQLAAEYAPAVTLSKEYIRFGGQVVAIENATAGAPCQTCYLSYDHLGSVRLVTDQNANIIARHDYLPFGEEILGGEAGRSSQWGATDSVNQKFTGQERDAETNLDFFQARYYTGGVMRFLSPDPGNAGADLSNPQSWNGYAYVGNNPLSAVDPRGLDRMDADGQNLINASSGKGIDPYTGGCMGGYLSCGGGQLQGAEQAYENLINAGFYANLVGGYLSNGNSKAANHIAQLSGYQISDDSSKLFGQTTHTITVYQNASIWSGTYTWPLTGLGAAIGSLTGPEGVLPGALIGSMLGVGVNVSFVTPTRSVYVGPVVTAGFGFVGGVTFTVAGVPSTQNPNSIAGKLSFSTTYQPDALAGATVIKSPGNGPPVVGFSFGSRMPVSVSGTYNWCIWNCGQ